jgi:hypothetical protein
VTTPDLLRDAVVLVGGTGVVGRQIAHAVRQRHPGLKLVLAGRDAARAAAVAAELGAAAGVAVDVGRPEPLAGAAPAAVISAVNDPGDHLLADALRLGVPLLDIARWTDRVRTASALVRAAPEAPVLLSSGWMGGICSALAAGVAEELAAVDTIDISVLYALKDKAGPDSAEYMDRLATPFPVTVGGEVRFVKPLSDGRRVAFPGAGSAKVYRFDTPDEFTLPATTGAKTVAARIGFDDAFTTSLLVALVRSGAWKLISGERFTGLRRRLLYNPGEGAGHHVVIDVTGRDHRGREVARHIAVSDPLGQTHLTAVAALVQLERLLGLDGAAPPPPGLVFPDSGPCLDAALETLRRFGVRVTVA